METRKLGKSLNFNQVRIRKVFRDMVEGKAKNMRAAMRLNGYSPKAPNPTKIRTSRTWNQLVDQYLAEDDVLTKHRDLLNAVTPEIKAFTFDVSTSEQEARAIIEGLPGSKIISVKENRVKDRKTNVISVVSRTVFYAGSDNRTQLEALDKAYKLRGSYAPEKSESKVLQLTLGDLRKMRDNQEI